MVTPEQAAGNAERAIREAAQRHLTHASLFLFGSRARGDDHRRSDFDLAVLPHGGYSVRERLDFEEALEMSSAVIYPVDVVDLSEAGKGLRRQVAKEGVQWKE